MLDKDTVRIVTAKDTVMLIKDTMHMRASEVTQPGTYLVFEEGYGPTTRWKCYTVHLWVTPEGKLQWFHETAKSWKPVEDMPAVLIGPFHGADLLNTLIPKDSK